MATQIMLPRDAEEREIPLSTLLLYDKDGNELNVKRIEFDTFNKKWAFVVQKGSYDGILIRFHPQEVYLTRPDSWEKLLDDLDNASKGVDNAECCYTHREHIEIDEQCHGCRLYSPECAYLAYADIAARIRKLSGEGEDE